MFGVLKNKQISAVTWPENVPYASVPSEHHGNLPALPQAANRAGPSVPSPAGVKKWSNPHLSSRTSRTIEKRRLLILKEILSGQLII